MSTVKNNNIFEKTSFLGGNSSEFIEELYAQYVQNPQSISNEWQEFFEGLKDNKDSVINTVNGPSWSPKKRKIKIPSNGEKLKDQILDTKNLSLDSNVPISEGYGVLLNN